jgi:hypothetical protein
LGSLSTQKFLDEINRGEIDPSFLMAGYTNCSWSTFVRQPGEDYQGRIHIFMSKMYESERGYKNAFLTDDGLVMIHSAKLEYNGLKLFYDQDSRNFKSEMPVFKAHWIQASKAKGKRSLTFQVSSLTGHRIYSIDLNKFKKTDELGGRSADGPKVNLGNEFEDHWQKDSKKFLEGHVDGPRYISKIKEINERFERETGLALADTVKEADANKPRPLAMSGNNIVVSAGGILSEEMGSTLTDITYFYGSSRTPKYLSLKFGPSVTFFNCGVRGGKKDSLPMFLEDELKSYNIKAAAGKRFLEIFGIDPVRFCQSFADYPRSSPIPNHMEVSRTYDKSAIEALLKSGIGRGYTMIHNTGTRGNAHGVKVYDVDASYMRQASTLMGGVTIYYGGRDGKGKRVDMVCESSKYKFSFNIRNKQGGQFPSHVMCDYITK